MKFGKFDDQAKEYVITRPDTPLPWINYLGTGEFRSLISQSAGGYVYYRDALLRRITRYRYNDIPLDSVGRYFYINDNGKVWSPGWKPVKTKLDNYECRHGMNYSIIKGEYNGIEAETLFFVPLNETVEIQAMTLKNKTNETKKFTLFSYMEFCLWNAQDDMTNFQRNLSTGEVVVEGSLIANVTEYRERRNHFSYYACTAPVSGFETDRATFTGVYGSLSAPDSVMENKSNQTIAHGWSPIASHCINIELKPGEEKKITFILGYVENAEDDKWTKDHKPNLDKARKTLEKYTDTANVAKEFAALKANWSNLLSKFTVKCDDPIFSRVVGTWNQYQCAITFRVARSASMFESGIGRGIGFRDTNQDMTGYVHLEPKLVRDRLIDVASTQREDGSAYHQYQPLTKRGNDAIGSGFNDDPLWLIFGVSAYIRETGDYKFLDEMVAFDNDMKKAGTMFEHLVRSFKYTLNNLGPHGLPLIGRADWNDCLNLNCFSKTPDESFQTCVNREGKVAESIFIAGLFVFVTKDFADLCDRIGKKDFANEIRNERAKMDKTTCEHGWDGEWYLRAYDAEGKLIGTDKHAEAKIFIEPQGMCGMAGIGSEKGFPLKALNATEKHLACKYGIVLQDPPYSDYHIELGEISSYPPGYKENAGIFCHNNPWVIISETMHGKADRALDYWKRFTPAYREEDGENYKCEPYAYAQMIAGKAAFKPGEAKNSWLTGTAAWTFVAASQYILGIKPEFDGLGINPRLPENFGNVVVEREFRGSKYTINISRKAPGNKVTLVVDGKEIAGTTVQAFTDGKAHTVDCFLG